MRAPKSFEEGMDRLEGILDQMQQPETTLAELVKLYAEAASLTDYCRATLEKASLQLDEIDAKRTAAQQAIAGRTADVRLFGQIGVAGSLQRSIDPHQILLILLCVIH